MDRNGLYIDIVLRKKRPKWAFDGFKGIESRVDSNLNALQNCLDHTEWSKMTIFGHFFFIFDYRRQEGKESEGKGSIFTC